MKCPYCDNEMELGYIQSRDGLGWNAKKRIVSALSGTFADQNLGKTAVAFRCKECKKMIIDYSNGIYPIKRLY